MHYMSYKVEKLIRSIGKYQMYTYGCYIGYLYVQYSVDIGTCCSIDEMYCFRKRLRNCYKTSVMLIGSSQRISAPRDTVCCRY